jgi:hypothetical protein
VEPTLTPRRLLVEAARLQAKPRLPRSEYIMNIFYIIGVVVVVIVVAGYLGVHI